MNNQSRLLKATAFGFYQSDKKTKTKTKKHWFSSILFYYDFYTTFDTKNYTGTIWLKQFTLECRSFRYWTKHGRQFLRCAKVSRHIALYLKLNRIGAMNTLFIPYQITFLVFKKPPLRPPSFPISWIRIGGSVICCQQSYITIVVFILIKHTRW